MQTNIKQINISFIDTNIRFAIRGQALLDSENAVNTNDVKFREKCELDVQVCNILKTVLIGQSAGIYLDT